MVGNRYLWIDSLCIIQDSDLNVDWLEQAPLMGQIYANSDCNIAATAAKDATEGCFPGGRPQDMEPCLVDPQWTSHPCHRLVCYDRNMWQHAIVDTKLLHRAWVQQEIALAPRVVHFADRQLFWECLELRACQTFPEGGMQKEGEEVKLSIDLYTRSDEEGSQGEHRRLWQSLVDSYTNSSLTFPEKDKLMAIAGVAKRMGEGSDYVAGLWRHDLVDGLMWRPCRENDDSMNSKPQISMCSRPDNFQAPSWSWAALNGPIKSTRGYCNMGAMIKPLDATTELLSDDAFGPVAGGKIRLEGMLAKLTIEESGHRVKMRMVPRADAPELLLTPDVGVFQTGSNVFYTPLIADDGSMGFFSYAGQRVQGLVLEPTGGPRGEYRRVGTFLISCRNKTVEGPYTVENFMERFQAPLDTEYFEKTANRDTRFGCDQYVFSVI